MRNNLKLHTQVTFLKNKSFCLIKTVLHVSENWFGSNEDAGCRHSGRWAWRAENCISTETASQHEMYSQQQCCLFSVLWCWTLQDNCGHGSQYSTPPPPKTSYLLSFLLLCLWVFWGFKCKIFSNKTFGNVILMACLISLINVTFYWVGQTPPADNRLCTWISLRLHLVTVARTHRWRQQAYICSLAHNMRISAERQTCFFFTCLKPPTDGSQQPPGALSPLLFFFDAEAVHAHQCGGGLQYSCIHKQTCCIIVSVVSVRLQLCLGEKRKHYQLLVNWAQISVLASPCYSFTVLYY